MNLKEIKSIIEDPFSSKDYRILELIAKDRNAINYVLSMLNREREEQEEKILDASLALSMAHKYIVDNKKDKRSRVLPTRDIALEKVLDFFLKYKDSISSCFAGTEWDKENKTELPDNLNKE